MKTILFVELCCRRIKKLVFFIDVSSSMDQVSDDDPRSAEGKLAGFRIGGRVASGFPVRRGQVGIDTTGERGVTGHPKPQISFSFGTIHFWLNNSLVDIVLLDITQPWESPAYMN